jgi:hypothetical protein
MESFELHQDHRQLRKTPPPAAHHHELPSRTSTTPFPESQVVFGRATISMSGAANRQGKMVSNHVQQLESWP